MRRSTPARRRHRDQRGLSPGGFAGIAVLVVLLAAGAFVIQSVYAAPDLGAPPAGRSDGATEVQIATSVAAQLATALAAQPHASVVLSESDLTVLARTHNPDPTRFIDPEVRVREGVLVLSAGYPLGPATTTAVAHVRLTLEGAGTAQPHFVSEVQDVSAGRIPIPAFLRGSLDDRVTSATASATSLLDSPKLAPLRSTLECVAPTTGGLIVGFHRPGGAVSTAVCGGPG